MEIKKKNKKSLKMLCIVLGLFLLGLSNVVANAQSVKLYPSTIRVQKGKTKTITAVAYNSSGQPVFNATFTNFSPASTTIASSSLVRVNAPDDISTLGTPPPNLRTITGNNAGTTTITATWNGITSSPATIIVDDPASSPTAIIHGDNDPGGMTTINTKVGEAIEINADSSQGVSQIEWNWGDGDKTTDLLSATHAYLAAGTYSLTLKVKNSSGQEAVSTITVNVSAQAQPTQIINVSTLQDLRNAYNSATGGEHIVIPAGTILQGELELPARTFSDYVTIRSSAAMPDIKTRVSPTQSGLVTFRGSYVNAVPFTIKNGASKIRLVGLKFDPIYHPEVNGISTYGLLKIGDDFQANASQNPNKIIIEHCVMNPPNDVSVAHGLVNDGYKISLISSWLGNIKTLGGQDSQAAYSNNGRGAHVYNNSLLEAASENVIYGGSVPTIDGLVGSNIEFRRCYFPKRLSWRVYIGESHPVNVKNLFETKNVRRLYVEGSVFENHWDALRQQTFALVFKTGTSPGDVGQFVPWAISEDIVFENAKINHIYGGITH